MQSPAVANEGNNVQGHMPSQFVPEQFATLHVSSVKEEFLCFLLSILNSMIQLRFLRTHNFHSLPWPKQSLVEIVVLYSPRRQEEQLWMNQLKQHAFYIFQHHYVFLFDFLLALIPSQSCLLLIICLRPASCYSCKKFAVSLSLLCFANSFPGQGE